MEEKVQGWREKLSQARWGVVDFASKVLGNEETDEEVVRLIEVTRDNPMDHQPQTDLAMAYVARIQEPPDWNDDDVKRAVKAFRKAVSLAKRHDRSQVAPVQEHFVETMYGVATAYQDYYGTDPDIKWLNGAVGVLEDVLPEAKENAGQATRYRDALRTCLMDSIEWHELRLESDVDREDYLNEYLSVADRARLYCDRDDPTQEAIYTGIGYNAAIAQLTAGSHYSARAGQSPVMSEQDGRLLNIEDKEHKAYASKAIQLLRSGRERLQQYSMFDDYDAAMEMSGEDLANAYGFLYNLTYAHTTMAKAIPILQEAVEVLPDDADLWHTLGNAYNGLADEVVEDAEARLEKGRRTARLNKDAAFGAAIGSRFVVGSTNKQIDKYSKKAEECFMQARRLAPDRY